jgi:CRISPR-associated exonuclease Cas4
MQLAAYALLVEDAMKLPAPAAFVYLTPSDQLIRINVTDRLKALVLGRLASIRQMVQEGILPEPTPVRARCEECEFRNYCGDIF